MSASRWTRREVLQKMAATGGAAALYDATASLRAVHEAHRLPVRVPAGSGVGQHVVIVGGGIAGLTTAYELLSKDSGYRVTILEAHDRVGGRNHTLRAGDTLVEETPDHGTTVQTCRFESEVGEPYAPYLNAGPGRINSSHVNLLQRCKELGIELEMFVMQSSSSLTHANGASIVRRRAVQDARGWIAQTLYEMVDLVPDLNASEREELRELLIVFGNLSTGDDDALCDTRSGPAGTYAYPGGPGGRLMYSKPGLPRAGFEQLPEVAPGVPVDPMTLNEVLATGFWTNSAVFQPVDFDWQPTLFQPVGGMDEIVHAYEAAIDAMGGRIEKSALVTTIRREPSGHFDVSYRRGGRDRRISCDHVVSNVPIPLLEGVLDPMSLSPQFDQALAAVFATQASAENKFLSDTTKVGWQGTRDTWAAPGMPTGAPPRVVPIFGGISHTTHSINQIWYPSSAREIYMDAGILTGAYNFDDDASAYGHLLPAERLVDARQGARELAGDEFADALRHGITVAWQNVPHIRGGWAQWQNVATAEGATQCVDAYNTLAAGDRDPNGHWLLICGDQMSQLPGWQEGAVMSAIHAVNLLTDPSYEAPVAASVPNSRYIVY